MGDPELKKGLCGLSIRSVLRGRSTGRRWVFALLAYLFAGLAIAGLAIPGLPTTPFVLLAAWAASRGSDRLDAWLRNHPRLGPPLRSWREEGAVSSRAKLIAVLFLGLSWLTMWRIGTTAWLLWTITALFVIVATFVLTRPRPRA